MPGNERAAVVAAMRWETRGLDGAASVLVVAGAGPARAEAAARRLIAAGATALVSWGAAAGLAPAVAPGALLLPSRVIAADGTIHVVDPDWHGRAVARMGPAGGAGASLAETVALLDHPAAKAALHRETGAVAGDMESAAVARVAHEHGAPLLVVRAVLDPASVAVPLAWARAVGADGRVRARRVAAALLRPALWPAGARLAVYRRRASRALRRAAPVLDGPCRP